MWNHRLLKEREQHFKQVQNQDHKNLTSAEENHENVGFSDINFRARNKSMRL